MSWCLLDLHAYDDDAVSYNLEKVFAEDMYVFSVQALGKNYSIGGSMNAINNVNVEGFISLDPIVKNFENGRGVAHISLGVPSYYKKDDELKQFVSFVPVDFFFDSKEDLPVLGKGLEVKITGRLKQDRWMVDDGSYQSRLKVVASSILPRL